MVIGVLGVVQLLVLRLRSLIINQYYVIRPAKPEDYHSGLAKCLNRFGSVQNYNDFVVTFNARVNDGIVTLVVVAGDSVVGTASYFLEKKFIHDGGLVAHNEDVCVDEIWERRGVGSDLVKTVLEMCKSDGCYKAILDCHDDIIPFYMKLGFWRHENCMRFNF